MEKILDFLFENYLIRGFYLLPVNRDSKLPLFKDYGSKASNDLEQIKAWAKQYKNCNWALYPKASGHIAIDVDLDDPEKDFMGMTTWKNLIDTNGEPNTWKAISGRLGLHYLFKADADVNYAGHIKDEKGIQTRYTNYILVEPSIHPKTKNMYKIENHGEPTEAPEWLKDLIVRNKKELTLASPKLTLGLQYLEKISDQIRDEKIPLDRETWLKIGMSLHAMSDSQEYLDFWVKISEENVNANSGNEYSECEYRWLRFKQNEDDLITGNSFIYICERLGCAIPNPTLDQDLYAFAMYERQRIEIEARLNPEWFKEDGKVVCRHKDFIVKEINDLGYASVGYNPDGAIIRIREEDVFKKYSQLDPKQTNTNFRTYFYKFYKQKANGDYVAQYKPAFDVWFEHCDSRSFTEICFDHKERPGALNMFVPIPCSPMPGNVSFLDILFDDVLCNGNLEKARVARQWFAHIIQRPHEHCSIVPTVIGAQGTGKGLLFIEIMKSMLKEYHHTVISSKGITDRFNAPLAFRLLTVIDEASWNGNHDESNMLKSITGNKTLDIEEKFGKKVTVNNYSRYAILSNKDNAMAIEATNRRIWVFETNRKYASDTAFFDPIFKFLTTPNAANMIYNYFMNIDISDFNPHILPVFDSLGQAAKEATEGPIAKYWLDRMGEEPKPIFTQEGYLYSRRVYLDFLEYKAENNIKTFNADSKDFWRKTKQLVPILENAEKSRLMTPKDASGLRTSFMAYKIDPEEFKDSLHKTLNVDLKDFSYFDLIEFDESEAF